MDRHEVLEIVEQLSRLEDVFSAPFYSLRIALKEVRSELGADYREAIESADESLRDNLLPHFTLKGRSLISSSSAEETREIYKLWQAKTELKDAIFSNSKKAH